MRKNIFKVYSKTMSDTTTTNTTTINKLAETASNFITNPGAVLKATTKDLYSQALADKEIFVSRFLWMLIFVFLVILANYYLNTIGNMQNRECKMLNALYGSIDGNLRALNDKDPNCGYNLRDYYIKTAYNCCSGGNYVNGFVSICALQNVIKQGVRGFDMEIYNIGGSPVVATSISDSYYIKGTYNYLDFADVMDTITNNCFGTTGTTNVCPNSNDPVILHLRFKSNNKDMFTKLASIMESYDNYMLDNSYSYQYNGQNLGAVPLLSLAGYIVIIVSNDNTTFATTDFNEYVNMTSGSPLMSALHYTDIYNTPSLQDLQNKNKTGMTIAMPDVGKDPGNPNGPAVRTAGCQMIAMRYQKVDNYLEENALFFDTNGYAFVLKPEHLRYIPVEVTINAQDPKLSYGTRMKQIPGIGAMPF